MSIKGATGAGVFIGQNIVIGATGPGGPHYSPYNGFRIQYKESILLLDYDGGIYLAEGNWTDAAIGLKIELNRKIISYGSHILKFKLGDIVFDVESKQISLDKSNLSWNGCTLKNPDKWEESQENFPILKDHFEKIHNMKAFW